MAATPSQLAATQRLVWWLTSLLASDMQNVARTELAAECPRDPVSTDELRTDELSERLRSAATVLDCDAALAKVRQPDWTVLAAEHRREPFGRVQRRALIARPDCPDALTSALLTPWDSLVAGRLSARQKSLPEWTWRAALARIGELRPSFLRHVLSDETVTELVLTTSRLDLLVRAVDGYDLNPNRAAVAFWECVGRLLRQQLSADQHSWLAAAAALPSHPGTFASLVRRVKRRATPTPAAEADLRILAQAPDAVLADVIADLPDPLLTHMEQRDLRPRRANAHLMSMVLDRFVAAGIPPRRLFARWTYGSGRTPATRSWAHGLDPLLDQSNEHSAQYDVTLRRLIVASSPRQEAVADLVSALRACTGAIEAEALLTSTLGENGSPPWPKLTQAHHESALPPHILCTLVARTGCPDALTRALPADLLSLMAAQSPTAARTAITVMHQIYNPWGLIFRIRARRTINDRELLEASSPAKHILQYASTPGHVRDGRNDGELLDHCGQLLNMAARSAPAGFWPALLQLLPVFEGTFPELLTAAATHAFRSQPSSGYA